jgi:uncharacterized protein (DUF2336 family)
LISELEDAVQGGSAEKRVETLRRVTDLFLDDADRLNEQQISVFDDVLVHLIQRIETKALVQLSTALAPVAQAPVQAVGRLARHKEISIAGPILTQSNRLSDNDLIEIARANGQAHLLAISGRSSLNTNVTDVLIERGDHNVTHRLARNAGARFSEAGYSAMVKKAEADGGLAEKLGLRLDIPLKLLRELLARATDAVRSRLLASASPEVQHQIQQALAGIAKEIGLEATGPRDFTASDSLVKELNRTGNLKRAGTLRIRHQTQIRGNDQHAGAVLPGESPACRIADEKSVQRRARRGVQGREPELADGRRDHEGAVLAPLTLRAGGRGCAGRISLAVARGRAANDALHDGQGHREEGGLAR